jgi:hypothetical protein
MNDERSLQLALQISQMMPILNLATPDDVIAQSIVLLHELVNNKCSARYDKKEGGIVISSNKANLTLIKGDKDEL